MNVTAIIKARTILFATQSKNKPLHDKISEFYRPLSVKLKDGKILVNWNNWFIPYGISECPEMVIKFRVTSEFMDVYGRGELRFNLKSLHDKVMLSAIDGNKLP